MEKIKVSASREYEVIIHGGILADAGKYIESALGGRPKLAVITDDRVDALHGDSLESALSGFELVKFVFKNGEASKSISVYGEILEFLAENNITRTDTIVAFGGGVVGDLSGFVAASYMRGIDFYNIPTTVLSQVDSSVGGKTAVNFGKIKNIIGAFYQPKAVLIDPETLKTLSKRHFSNGLAEAVKTSLTFDKELFELFEKEDIEENIEKIIEHSVISKAKVVEQDEKEAGLRKVLNFGHTIGHAIESAEELGGLYHGECVALGMIPMCSEEIRERLIPVLKKLGLPTEYSGDLEKLISAASHDKKFSGSKVTVITLPEIENFRMEDWTPEKLFDRIKEFFA